MQILYAMRNAEALQEVEVTRVGNQDDQYLYELAQTLNDAMPKVEEALARSGMKLNATKSVAWLVSGDRAQAAGKRGSAPGSRSW